MIDDYERDRLRKALAEEAPKYNDFYDFWGKRYLMFCFLAGYSPSFPAREAYNMIEEALKGSKDNERSKTA